MKKHDVPLLLALAGAIGVALTVPDVAALQPARALDSRSIERFVSDYQTRVGIPGVAVVVTKGKELVSVLGVGRDSRGEPITAQTPMPIASLSKSFTAMAVMQLVERGSIRLDGSVGDYLPDFRLADPRAVNITIRQLLAHTSGMSDTAFHEKSGPLPATLAGGITRLRSAGLAGEPGLRARYHNPNYWVAARIVEVVSGESFDSYLRHHVFELVGMPNTRTVGSLGQVSELAQGHIRLYGRALALPEPPWFLDGASGIVTTAADLAQWLIVQSRGGEAANGTRIISAAYVAEMHKGLGWTTRSVGGITETEHTGWMFTFTAHQILLEETGYGIAVMSNLGLGLSPVDSTEIAQALAEMTTGEVPRPPARTASIVDSVLAGLTLLALVLGLRSTWLAATWAQRRVRRPAWRTLLALLRGLLPLALLLSLPALLSVVFGGRDASWVQLLYFAPSLVVWLTTASLVGLAVIAARIMHLMHQER